MATTLVDCWYVIGPLVATHIAVTFLLIYSHTIRFLDHSLYVTRFRFISYRLFGWIRPPTTTMMGHNNYGEVSVKINVMLCINSAEVLLGYTVQYKLLTKERQRLPHKPFLIINYFVINSELTFWRETAHIKIYRTCDFCARQDIPMNGFRNKIVIKQ